MVKTTVHLIIKETLILWPVTHYNFTLASLCLVPGAHSVMFSVELFPRDVTDACAVGSTVWKLLPTSIIFFLSVPLFSTSEWDDLSVELIQALELCQAVGKHALWSIRVTKNRCRYSSAYLIVRNDWFSDNLAHNHHTVTTCWPFSPVIKMNWHSPCRLATPVLVSAWWAGQSMTIGPVVLGCSPQLLLPLWWGSVVGQMLSAPCDGSVSRTTKPAHTFSVLWTALFLHRALYSVQIHNKSLKGPTPKCNKLKLESPLQMMLQCCCLHPD